MNPETDHPPVPGTNPTGQPQRPVPAPPASNPVQPTVSYRQDQPTDQTQATVNAAQSAEVVGGDSGQQLQNPPAKHKMLLIIAGAISLLLIGSVAAFFILRSSSNSEQPASNNTQPASNNVQVQSGEATDSELNDNLRRFAVNKLIVEVANFQANNNGIIPTLDDINNEIIPDYVLDSNNNFSDPTTNEQYVIVEGEPKIGEMQYATASSCDGGEIVPASTRYLVVRALLESGEFYCLGS